MSSATPASDGCKGHDDRPAGDPSQYSAPDLPNITIAAPQICAHGDAYIRVERTTGARRLGTAGRTGEGFVEGCRRVPEHPEDPEDCPVINALFLLQLADSELHAQHLETFSLGMGPCAAGDADYASWNISTAVGDWRAAAALVHKIAELLERYDLRGYTGAAVLGLRCAVPQ